MVSKEEVAAWLWQNKEWVAEKVAAVYAWFRGPGKAPEKERGILIIGPGGVGKTTFAQLLTGSLTLNDFLAGALAGYEESLGVEHYTYGVEGGAEVEVVVPPGQQKRQGSTWDELLSNLAAGRFRGVALLGCCGYHSLGLFDWRDTATARREKTADKDSFLPLYTRDKREEEIAVVNRIADAMKFNPEKCWLLSLVTKEDLWWPERADVTAHYQGAGRYARALEAGVSGLDARRFRHELVFASLIISNFSSGALPPREGELLRENTAGYDHPRQAASLRKLIETVDALREWEVGS